MAADLGTYLYAIAREPVPPCPEGLTGVAGEPVRTVAGSGLVAYVGTVPLDRFGEEPLRRSMEDLDWLGATARAHDRVVAAVAASAPTAPVRLVTVYSGDEQVRDLLEERRAEFLDVLARVAGREEWGVKAYAEPVAETPEPKAANSGASSPGTAYLKRRQAGLHERERVWREAGARAMEIHRALSGIAVAGRLHRAQDPQLSGRRDWMVLNGAYLVDRDRAGEFRRAVDRLRGRGLQVELTGPWAPYSFAVLEEGRHGVA
ncbi:GvpL/GvpF family gas vesicle protein [Thermoactinospora rubra]|uniref:GvpL/GvpF family gas vesicle protein n=1 Tax=Thermoactinospora rubra TaxID=1088767 RepID=UPI000A12314C|nr:GvpL/GvpF family gas vesicle protein [Thermoactinospora rubra]